MEHAREQPQSDFQSGTAVDDLIDKVKIVAQSSHGELFLRIVDDFYEQVTEEYFSPEDLAEIEEGFAQIKRGECLTLEEYRSGKRL